MSTDPQAIATWPRFARLVKREELLHLIEANGGAFLLDLRGITLAGDGDDHRPWENPADLSPETVAALADDRSGRSGETRISWVWRDHGMNLFGAWLDGAFLIRTDLRQAHLGLAGLRQAMVLESRLAGACFNGAQVQGADFMRSDLRDCDLRGAQLHGANLSQVASLHGARWYGAVLDRTLLSRESVGNVIGDELWARQQRSVEAYREAEDAYLRLKSNFTQIGRYEDASWAHVKEQQMERMACLCECRRHGWRFWRAWGSFWRWLRNWAYELTTGYGERPWMPALWAMVVVAAFVAIYAGAGNVSPDFAGDPAQAQGSHSLLDALTHSIGAFATIGFNTLEPLGWGARLLTAIESAFGIGLFALFIFTLGNRMSRG